MFRAGNLGSRDTTWGRNRRSCVPWKAYEGIDCYGTDPVISPQETGKIVERGNYNGSFRVETFRASMAATTAYRL